ncbi:TPA: glutamate--tRNA ligase [Patescibacteria group bacterium]|uniref:Glutamate--tRNA ligase n=1 Tax=Candidatus Gottesmanbacteria bacterium GW2011_GWA1_43_11 TaxID=1618436 RepID=A0A0G1FF34_9BACT|nr:MAG: Glutamate-tRNA ligase [Candidatus Gottesmanbacteria bacterium GW2011_GWA1_43_11]HCS78248.1 glutamate--tRNA ligase [Patescibacteria group bacterium]
MDRVRTRIAPSPTGDDLHVGNVYTALFNYIWSKKHKGKFIVRIEDTDRLRFVPQTEARILASLRWLGLAYDEGPDIGGAYAPYRQSERLPIYQKYALKLIEAGRAYYCFCSSERLEKLRKSQHERKLPTMYDGHCKEIPLAEARRRASVEPNVIRLNVPEKGETIFSDMIRGKIHFQNAVLDDQVLIKSDGYPTYHLAVVIDDYLMQVTHVIRGEDWISSTPKHVILYWAFGWTLPYFAHLPLLRNPDKSKLSKRKNPVWTSWYREQGYLPEALLNYLGTMTWSMPDGRDKFSLSEMIEAFDIKKIKTTAPIFDLEKLSWLNGQYIRELSTKELASRLTTYLPKGTDTKLINKLAPLAQPRMKTLTEFTHYLGPFVAFKPVPLSTQEKNITREFIAEFELLLPWKTQQLELTAKKLVTQKNWKLREAFMALRQAVTGEKIGLPLFETLELLGKKEALLRMRQAL